MSAVWTQAFLIQFLQIVTLSSLKRLRDHAGVHDQVLDLRSWSELVILRLLKQLRLFEVTLELPSLLLAHIALGLCAIRLHREADSLNHFLNLVLQSYWGVLRRLGHRPRRIARHLLFLLSGVPALHIVHLSRVVCGLLPRGHLPAIDLI